MPSSGSEMETRARKTLQRTCHQACCLGAILGAVSLPWVAMIKYKLHRPDSHSEISPFDMQRSHAVTQPVGLLQNHGLQTQNYSVSMYISNQSLRNAALRPSSSSTTSASKADRHVDRYSPFANFRKSLQGGCLLALGDGITLGSGNAYKPWRYILAHQLHMGGYHFQWTGSMEGFCTCADQKDCAWNFTGDEASQRHEGHVGWTTEMILNGCLDRKCDLGEQCSGKGMLKNWTSDYKCSPTCSLINLGSNDMRPAENTSASTTIQNLKEIVSLLKQTFATTILLAVPSPTCNPQVQGQLAPLILELEDPSAGVHLVRLDIGFDGEADVSDTCNPNAQGNEKMANKWHSAILEHCIQDISTTSRPEFQNSVSTEVSRSWNFVKGDIDLSVGPSRDVPVPSSRVDIPVGLPKPVRPFTAVGAEARDARLVPSLMTTTSSVGKSGCLLALGDSITLGAGNAYKPWRYILARQLHEEGYSFQWTGSMKGFCTCKDTFCTWKFLGDGLSQQHEGHSGWTTGMILNGCPKPDHCPFGNTCSGSNALSEWARHYECSPTCTLIHLGSNDMREKKNIEASTALENLKSIISFLKNMSSTTILLAVPIPSCDPKLPRELSPLILGLEDTAGNVHLVRQDIGFNTSTDLKDVCHPNDRGNEKMAQKWHAAILKHCIRHGGASSPVAAPAASDSMRKDNKAPEAYAPIPEAASMPPAMPLEPRRPASHLRKNCLLALGDSITEGAGREHKPWRYILARQLHENGYPFQWVGSMNGFCKRSLVKEETGHKKCADDEDCKWGFVGDEQSTRHEGHSGWTSKYIFHGCKGHCPFACTGNGKLKTWTKDYQCMPTCTLIHLGSNDMRPSMHMQAETTIQYIMEIIRFLRRFSNTTVLLAVPIPSCTPRVTTELAPLIVRMEGISADVHIVRQDIDFDNTTDLKDSCHPNSVGNEKIAQKWYSAILKHCVRDQ